MAAGGDLPGRRIPNRPRLPCLAHPPPEAGRAEGQIAVPRSGLGGLHPSGHEEAGVAPQAVALPPANPSEEDIRPGQALESPPQILSGIGQWQVLIHPAYEILRALIQVVGSLQGLLGPASLEYDLKDLEDGCLDIPLSRDHILQPDSLLALGCGLKVVDRRAHIPSRPLGNGHQCIWIALHTLRPADLP